MNEKLYSDNIVREKLWLQDEFLDMMTNNIYGMGGDGGGLKNDENNLMSVLVQNFWSNGT